jgi:UDP-glucose 4-epimerase
MQTICLRPPWVWVPETKEMSLYRKLRTEYPNWYKNLWAYIHVHDVAYAVRQCLESSSLPTHESYFICSTQNWVEANARDLAAQHFPETSLFRRPFDGPASFISCQKAVNAFGFSPRFTWRDIIP